MASYRAFTQRHWSKNPVLNTKWPLNTSTSLMQVLVRLLLFIKSSQESKKDSQKTTEVLEQKSYTLSPYFSSEDAVPFSIQRLKQLSFFHSWTRSITNYPHGLVQSDSSSRLGWKLCGVSSCLEIYRSQTDSTLPCQ